MAIQNKTADDVVLLDVKVAEASSLHKFYLNQEKKILGTAAVGVMVGELYAATAGIGFMITVAGATFQIDKVFVGVVVFAISGMVTMELLSKVEQRFDKWRPKVGAA